MTRESIRPLFTLPGAVWLVAGLLVAPAAVAQMQAPATESPAAAIPDRPPGIVYGERASLTAMVEAVDRDKRTVTLKKPDGTIVHVTAPPEMRNFDQVQPGDTVRAEYIGAVAVRVRKPGAAPDAGAISRVTVAPKGEKPAAEMVDVVEMTATVDAIDPVTRTVTLRGPDGKTTTLAVDPSVGRLDEVKPGDEVVIRHTRALAIAVER
jgi:hypothetical protein